VAWGGSADRHQDNGHTGAHLDLGVSVLSVNSVSRVAELFGGLTRRKEIGAVCFMPYTVTSDALGRAIAPALWKQQTTCVKTVSKARQLCS
jgi:hypothetical protein